MRYAVIAHPVPAMSPMTSISSGPDWAGSVRRLRASFALCLTALLLLLALGVSIHHRQDSSQAPVLGASQVPSAAVTLLSPEAESRLTLAAAALLTLGLALLLLSGAAGSAPPASPPTHWNALPLGVLVQDGSGAVLEANAAAEQLLGLSLAQLQGQQPWPFGWRLGTESAPVDAVGLGPLAALPAERAQRLGQAVREEVLRLRLPDGALRWLSVDCAPLGDASRPLAGTVICIRDISEQHRQAERLIQPDPAVAQAHLPSRAQLMTQLERVIAHAARHAGYGFALLAIEVDSAGTAAEGASDADLDDLRQQIERRLAQSLRPGDLLAALDANDPGGEGVASRTGLDFGAMLEGIASRQELEHVVSRVRAELSEPFLLGCYPVQLSARLGAVLSSSDAAGPQTPSPEGLLSQTLMARGEVPRIGLGGWALFVDSMQGSASRRLAIHTDLIRALDRDEFFLVYQPLVDLAGGALCGVEALLRWRHPQRGLVEPLDFVGVAEETGLTLAIGDWTLRRACADLAQWRQSLGAQAPAVLAVKVSRQHLQRSDLIEALLPLLAQHQLPLASLRLEWSEADAGLDDAAIATLRRLKGLGLGLGLDDFGSGQPSLARLQQLPVDLVKIERALVRQAGSSESQFVLIEATARVAASLGMSTVAKGVETETQAALMRQLQCNSGEGPLYGAAMTARALEAWLRVRVAETA